MHTFNETVPFDPGFSALSFSFIGNAAILSQDFSKQKSNNQKKFWLIKNEAIIVDLINKSSAFYLGCILWGGFLSNKFKNNPKKITGNTTENMTKEDLDSLDCAVEAKFILKYINNFNRDFKYFLGRNSKVSDFITEILDSYIEFADINNNFVNLKTTNEINIPKVISHFETLSDSDLDVLCDKIYDCINSRKIENLLNLEFYNRN